MEQCGALLRIHTLSSWMDRVVRIVLVFQLEVCWSVTLLERVRKTLRQSKTPTLNNKLTEARKRENGSKQKTERRIIPARKYLLCS